MGIGKMGKILICDGMHEAGLAILRSAEGLQVDMPDQPTVDEVRGMISGYEAVVVRSRTRITADLIENAHRLKVIGRAGTGIDNIDLQAASARGILVMNTPGANAMAAAKNTRPMTLLMSSVLTRRTLLRTKERICSEDASDCVMELPGRMPPGRKSSQG